MPNEQLLSQLISQLTRKTISGEINWRRKRSPSELEDGTNDKIPFYFETEFNGSRIGLASRRFQDYNPEVDSFLWSERPVLVFINSSGQVDWEYQDPSSGLPSLLEEVKEASAGIDKLLKKLVLGGDVGKKERS